MKKSALQIWGPYLTFLYGGMVLYYYLSGLLAFLVNPVYNKLILTGGILLIALGFYWIKNHRYYHPGSCDDRPSKTTERLILLFLVVPLIFGIFFKPKPLSSASALLRGVSSDLAVSEFDPAAFAKPSDQRSLMEWVRIINVDPEPDHYKGQPVSIEGNVILDEKLPENTFHLGRYVLTCCVADARVIALPVEYKPAGFNPINDSWIRVNGFLKEGIIEGNRQIVIRLESAEDIPIPDDAYELYE